MSRAIVLTAVLLAALCGPAAAQPAKRPNILIIVADDLGFSDLGAFGGEIETPALDALALSGLRLTGFHTAPACSPTRAMLLTGSDSHRVGLGAMRESLAENQKGLPGYEGHLRPDAPTLAERLSASGYRTLFSGKWHLGLEPENDPHARGFQHSFSFLQGAHYHFGPRPASTWADPDKRFAPLVGVAAASGMINPLYRQDGVDVPQLPEDFYSSDAFATKLIEQIKTTQAAKGDAPFFAYLAFTAPHAPLQAPRETIAKYKGRYDDGFEVLRAQRLKRQVELGLLPASAAAHPLAGGADWDALSAEEKRVSSRNMEIYAAMVDRLDQNVGRVVAALKETGEFDNTVIIFLSDNGAEGGDYTSATSPPFSRHVAVADNSLDNLGANTSFSSYGPAWAQAGSAPSWLYKMNASEGGTRSVAFITGPVVRQPGKIGGVYTHVTDIVPTVLQIVGAQPPESAGHPSTHPIDGLSWTSFLKDGSRVYPADRSIGTELGGSRALRQGDWKITDVRGTGDWRLFNIAADPGETQDLSAEEPDRKARLLKGWDAYVREVNVVSPIRTSTGGQ